MPVTLPWPYPVNRVFWANGTTVTSNVDFGIYTPSGTRIYSTGSTAQSGASAPQFVTPTTPFILSPGRYLFAVNCDGTTNRLAGFLPTAVAAALSGMLTQAVGAVTLPNPATFATFSNVGIVLCGITRTPSGF
jgi:hypothetical protein